MINAVNSEEEVADLKINVCTLPVIECIMLLEWEHTGTLHPPFPSIENLTLTIISYFK
jgi:hypothetical protein